MAEESQALVHLGGQDFHTLEAVTAWIATQPRQTHVALQRQAMDWLTERREKSEQDLLKAFEWIDSDKAYLDAGMTLAQYQDDFKDVSEIVKEIKERTAKEMDSNLKRVKEKCVGPRGKVMEHQITAFGQMGEYGKTFFAMLATIFSKTENLQQACEIINGFIWERVKKPKRGQPADPRLRSSDLSNALKALRDPKFELSWLLLTTDDLKKHGVTYGAAGFMEPLETGAEPQLPTVFEGEDELPTAPSSETGSSKSSSSSESGESDGAEHLSFAHLKSLFSIKELEEMAEKAKEKTPEIDPAGMAKDKQATSTPAEKETAEAGPSTSTPRGIRKTTRAMAAMDISEGDEEEVETPSKAPPKKKRKTPAKKPKDGAKESSPPEEEAPSHEFLWRKLKADEKSVCSCPIYLLEQHWPQYKEKIRMKSYTFEELKEMIVPLRSADERSAICIHHLSKFAGIMDLKECDTQEEYARRILAIFDVVKDRNSLAPAVFNQATRDFFDPRIFPLVEMATEKKADAQAWKYKPGEIVDLDPTEGMEQLDGPSSNTADLTWVFKRENGIVLADVFLMELDMYLHHFKINEMQHGFLPIFHSLSQQFIRQEPQIHRLHAGDSWHIESIAVPSPLRFRSPECPQIGIQFFGFDDNGTRPSHEDLVLNQLGYEDVEVECFTPENRSIRRWLKEQSITNGFLALEDWGVATFSDELLATFQSQLTTNHYTSFTIVPGVGSYTENARFQRFRTEPESVQLWLSSYLLPLDMETKKLDNGMDLQEVRSWHQDLEVPSKALYKGLWDSSTAIDFPVTVPLTGLGTLSDAMMGRISWKRGGKDAFKEFWRSGNGVAAYQAWQLNAIEKVWHGFQVMRDLEMKAFGENSFFLKPGVAEKFSKLLVLEEVPVASGSRVTRGKGKGKAKS
jgi:hypothetical protein